MAIPKVFRTVIAGLRQFGKLYFGPPIPDLWSFSRLKAGQSAGGFERFVLPNHPLAGMKADFIGLSPSAVRDKVRHAVRTGEIDLKVFTRPERPRCHRGIVPWGGPMDDVGDRRSLRNKRHVPFLIVVSGAQFNSARDVHQALGRETYQMLSADQVLRAKSWDALSQAEKEKALLVLFDRINYCLKYLSGKKFSLSLAGITFVSEEVSSFPKDQGGFVMLLQHSYDGGGHYHGIGRFLVSPDSLFRTKGNLFAGIPIHEMMHGLLCSGHSAVLGRNVFSLSRTNLIGLHEREANYLGWPAKPAVQSTTNYFLPLTHSPI